MREYVLLNVDLMSSLITELPATTAELLFTLCIAYDDDKGYSIADFSNWDKRTLNNALRSLSKRKIISYQLAGNIIKAKFLINLVK